MKDSHKTFNEIKTLLLSTCGLLKQACDCLEELSDKINRLTVDLVKEGLDDNRKTDVLVERHLGRSE